MILLDRIPSLGQLIMPALTLAINVSFFSITQAQSEQQEKFQQRRKKSPTIMGWEVGGGLRIGSLYTPMVDSCQCMAKSI